jgi:hypothetical protein
VRLKDASVKLDGANWRIWQAAIITESVLKKFGAELVLTSVNDGKHMDGSLHYKGCAFDVRTWQISGREMQVVAELKTALGQDFDVVLEKDHIHIELDPE